MSMTGRFKMKTWIELLNAGWYPFDNYISIDSDKPLVTMGMDKEFGGKWIDVVDNEYHSPVSGRWSIITEMVYQENDTVDAILMKYSNE